MKKITTTAERITNRSDKTLNYYLAEIKKYDLLSPDEEYELSCRMANGDELARERLIKHNLRFVVSVAKQYYGVNVTLGDLINEGNVGLIKASERFEPSMGFKFISYGVWWIRKAIIEFLSNKGESVRIPISKSYKMGKIKEQYLILEQKLGRAPSEIELLKVMGNEYCVDDVMMFYSQFHQNNVFLDDRMSDDSSTSRSDFLINTTLPNSDNLVDKSDSTYRLTKYLGILKPKQREVLTLLFGLDGGDDRTMESISREMGISKERVRQLKEESLSILRTKINFN